MTDAERLAESFLLTIQSITPLEGHPDHIFITTHDGDSILYGRGIYGFIWRKDPDPIKIAKILTLLRATRRDDEPEPF